MAVFAWMGWKYMGNSENITIFNTFDESLATSNFSYVCKSWLPHSPQELELALSEFGHLGELGYYKYSKNKDTVPQISPLMITISLKKVLSVSENMNTLGRRNVSTIILYVEICSSEQAVFPLYIVSLHLVYLITREQRKRVLILVPLKITCAPPNILYSIYY